MWRTNPRGAGWKKDMRIWAKEKETARSVTNLAGCGNELKRWGEGREDAGSLSYTTGERVEWLTGIKPSGRACVCV